MNPRRSSRREAILAISRVDITPERKKKLVFEHQIYRGNARGSRQYTVDDSQLGNLFWKWKTINANQYRAAEKYRDHYRRAGMDCLRSPNLDRVGGGIGFSAMPRDNFEAHHRQQLRRARDVIGLRGEQVVEGTVIWELSLEKLGYQIGLTERNQAIGVARDRLQHALDQLTDLWGT